MLTPMTKVRFSICLDAETAARLSALAAENDVSQSHLVRRALRREYGNEPRPNAGGEWLQSAAPWTRPEGAAHE